MSAGWVKLHRAVIDHPRSADPAWMSVWIHLLLLATHKPIKMVFGSEVIELQPGQLITSRKSLSKKTSLHQSHIERVLRVMISEHQIEQRTSSVSRLLTILNWVDYQQIEQPSEQRANNERTTSEQPPDTNKKLKKYKKVKNIEVAADGSLQLEDGEWLEKLVSDPTYAGVDVRREFGKCRHWCDTNHRNFTRKMFVGWMNRAKPEGGKIVGTEIDWFRDVRDIPKSAELEALR